MKTKKLKNPAVGMVVTSDNFPDPMLGYITAVEGDDFTFRNTVTGGYCTVTAHGASYGPECEISRYLTHISFNDIRQVTAMTRRETERERIPRTLYRDMIDDSAAPDDYHREDVGMFEMSLSQAFTVRVIGPARSAESFEKRVLAIDPEHLMRHYKPKDLESRTMHSQVFASASAPLEGDLLMAMLHVEKSHPLPPEDLDDRIDRTARDQDMAAADIAHAARDFISELGLGQAFTEFLARREFNPPDVTLDDDGSAFSPY